MIRGQKQKGIKTEIRWLLVSKNGKRLGQKSRRSPNQEVLSYKTKTSVGG